jgi:hypothetical protein
VQEYPGTVIVCDSSGTILELNNRAVESLRPEGGKKLIGTNLFDCHPEPARSQLKRMMKNRETNVYTIRKGRVRKIVVQTPWYRRGKYAGFVEITTMIKGKIGSIVRRP